MWKKDKEEWYSDGLRFSCTMCGNCCTGAPGYVWFNDNEAHGMAAHLGMETEAFLKQYAHRKFGKWSLNEQKNEHGEYDCVFLIELEGGKRGCKLYKSRPAQCKTWPFWPENLRSPRTWQQASRDCPGMAGGAEGEGTFYPIEQIRIILDQNEF
ncbi:YkgJ family cysteine cluster protein [Poriferisphaera sp. WC338]|uniref:YkgJ family cysteine cluster protein n=1 Tax=Poriferisphaera sp. WC338 TaxID=3425129 RepID=UPI003D81B582